MIRKKFRLVVQRLNIIIFIIIVVINLIMIITTLQRPSSLSKSQSTARMEANLVVGRPNIPHISRIVMKESCTRTTILPVCHKNLDRFSSYSISTVIATWVTRIECRRYEGESQAGLKSGPGGFQFHILCPYIQFNWSNVTLHYIQARQAGGDLKCTHTHSSALILAECAAGRKAADSARILMCIFFVIYVLCIFLLDNFSFKQAMTPSPFDQASVSKTMSNQGKEQNKNKELIVHFCPSHPPYDELECQFFSEWYTWPSLLLVVMGLCFGINKYWRKLKTMPTFLREVLYLDLIVVD